MNTDKHKFLLFLLLLLTFTFCLLPCVAQTLAPGAPGKDAQWATAGKQAVGTAANLNSKVWFTLANGVMTEVYYPDVTVANVHLLQFVVVNPKTKKVETEFDDAVHQIRVLRQDSLSFQQINTAKSGQWKITKTYTTDVKSDTILIDVRFEKKTPNLNLYVYYDPSLNNSGMGDKAFAPLAYKFDDLNKTQMNNKGVPRNTVNRNRGAGLGASDGAFASALFFSSDIDELNSGFYGVSDGLEQLREFGKIREPYSNVKTGNVVQMAKILQPQRFKVVLTFAKGDYSTTKATETGLVTLQKSFVQAQAEYDKEWSDYIKTLRKVEPKYQAQFNMAAMILKAFEDKTNRGANIASLSKPWGGALNANDVGSSGYHAVWARDLYQVATAFMALGDKDAANRALDFLFKIQQKPDGSFPQNSWIDGRPIGGSLQMDQVGFPLILAHELGRFDQVVYQKHIKPAADFIIKNGSTTPQERWEEKGGYSPSTIAAQIAGLVCAAEIAKKNGDNDSAKLWLKTADEWQQNVEKWTVTTTGKHSKLPYYVRLTQNGKPDAGEKYEINGVYGMVDERDIVDAGFLELVRLGIKSPNDKIIQNSIAVVDKVISVKTPNGEGFYRYNFDSYGEPDSGQRWNFDGKYSGKGRLWALLSGERGQYEIAECGMRNADLSVAPALAGACYAKAKQRLETMSKFANDGLMIPEQIWDSPNVPKNINRQFMPELKFGEGTGSATPLAWSMAQFIRLAVNLQEGRNLDTPKVVYERYVLGKKAEVSSQNSDDLTEVPLSFKVGIDNIPCFFDTSIPSSKCLKTSIAVGDTTKNPIFVNCIAGFVITCKDLNKEMHACFNFKGEFKTLEIAGDFTGWKPKKLEIERTEKPINSAPCLTFAKTARVEYKLIVDGKWITDPLNPNKVDNGVGGENSFFTMPDYKPTTWDKDEENNLNKNQISVNIQSLETLEIDSKVYGEKRKIQVLGPMANEIRTTFYPVLYLQDGGDYINRANAVKIQQKLLKAGKIEPFMIVFLDPKDRMKEYWANDDYAKFLAEEVVPFIDSKYNTIKSRDGRAVMGASLGGITAVHLGLKYPQVFGRIGGQSSSFWIDNERVVKDLEKLDGKTPYKFYFDDGTLEGVEDSRKVVKILKDKGFDVTYVEGEAGHNWTAWRDRLADAFIAIWK